MWWTWLIRIQRNKQRLTVSLLNIIRITHKPRPDQLESGQNISLIVIMIIFPAQQQQITSIATHTSSNQLRWGATVTTPYHIHFHIKRNIFIYKNTFEAEDIFDMRLTSCLHRKGNFVADMEGLKVQTMSTQIYPHSTKYYLIPTPYLFNFIFSFDAFFTQLWIKGSLPQNSLRLLLRRSWSLTEIWIPVALMTIVICIVGLIWIILVSSNHPAVHPNRSLLNRDGRMVLHLDLHAP